MTGLFEGITSKLKYENRIKEVILYFCTVPSFSLEYRYFGCDYSVER